MNFEDLKKFFFRKPKNALEGSEDAAPADKPAKEAAIPEKLVEKCEKCGQIILSDELRDNFGICPKCGHYKKIDARARIALCAEQFAELFSEVEGGNPLDFPGYDEKLAALREKTGEKDGVVARMQEGIVSLMQMAKTSAAVAKHSEAGLLYIAVLTDPTTGGVSASFAFEADIIIAEQGALVGFAGPRVIEQTIRQKLPAGFQRAEFLQQKGFVDRIVPRREMPALLASLLQLHSNAGEEEAVTSAPASASSAPAAAQTADAAAKEEPFAAPASENAPAAQTGAASENGGKEVTA